MDIHKALSGETRQQILQVLSDGPKYLSQLASLVNKKPQTLNFHLNLLLLAGIVRSEWKSGRKYYILQKEHRPSPSEPRSLHPELLIKLNAIESKLDQLLRKRRIEHLY